jgi:hypothetical protein
MPLSYKDQWIKHCLDISSAPASFYSGCRKIIRPITLTFTQMDDSLQLSDAGYTSSKMRMLEKNYIHHESRKVAVELWNKRRGQAKYGSVGFTCYAHFVKGGSIDAKRSKRASTFGPCLTAVIITMIDKKTYAIDVPYRTTEVLKKFPADLVFLRDVLLEPFDFKGLKLDSLNFYFANLTCHPMYWVTIMPHLKDPIADLDRLHRRDKYFYDWVIKWSARYLCPEYFRGIAKFSQAVRVQMDANKRLDKRQLKRLQKYVRDNHPGYRSDYVAPEEEENE